MELNKQQKDILKECYDFVEKVVKEPAKFVGVGEKDPKVQMQNQQVYSMCLATIQMLEGVNVAYAGVKK